MQEHLFLIAGYLGLFLLIWRLKPWLDWGKFSVAEPDSESKLNQVSVILPVRNEADNIQLCLEHLLRLGAREVIVVDDQSDDATPQILADFAATAFLKGQSLKLLSAPPKPPGWAGKSWACQLGADQANGDYLLFTDADTLHEVDSLAQSLQELELRKLDLLSAMPYHLNLKFWERLMSPLQLIALAVTAPFDSPKPRRLYAIGQYLLFKRQAYQQLGGHRERSRILAEDLHFAQACLTQELNYGVSLQRLYRVRMYACLSDFLAGWRRLCLLGLEFSSPWSGPEVVLYYLAFSGGGGQLGFTPASLLLMLLTLSLCWWLQPRLGRFSVLGPLFFPFALACFAWATALSLIDRLQGRVSWRGRSYTMNSAGEIEL